MDSIVEKTTHIFENHTQKTISGEWPLMATLRFALALIVVYAHTRIFSTIQSWDFDHNAFGPVIAVISFLVISGYSIAHSLDRYADTKRFYLRRAKRILPVYRKARKASPFMGEMDSAGTFRSSFLWPYEYLFDWV